jgi:hypothetical protein
MDQLMIGYGMNSSNGTNPPAGYNSDMILSGENSSNKQNQPKKELTLSEKHELATKLENEFTLDAHNVKNTSFTSSMSLNNMKPTNTSNTNTKNLADSLMNKNLADLDFNTFNTSSNKATPMIPNSQSTNFLAQNTSQNRFQAPNNFNQNSNNMFGNMNNQSFQQQRPPFQQPSMNNQQMGFFGNLALPAPGDSNSSIKSSGFPSIAPPPNLNTLKPATNLNSFVNKTSSPPQANAKKSALDDLADIFG